MITPEEKTQFLEQGWLHVPGILQGDHLARIQAEFDRVWELPGQSNQHKLLQHTAFLELMEHPSILERSRRFSAHKRSYYSTICLGRGRATKPSR